MSNATTKNATKRLTVMVSRNHIKQGWRKACGMCPIALALKERCSTEYVTVLNFHANIHRFGFYKLSKAALRFISTFDSGGKVMPATFVFRRMRDAR